MTNQKHTGWDREVEGEDSLGRLIARAGRRAEPPELLEAQVRAVVRDEWQRVADRRRRRNYMIVAAAAVVAFTAVGVGALLQLPQPGATQPLAQIVRTAGDVRFIAADGTVQRIGAAPFEEALHAGDEIVTASRAGINLTIDGQDSVRVGPASRLKWLDAHRARLLSGAVYVDSPRHDAAAPLSARPRRQLTIETDFGRITHVGTQYLVQVAPSGLVVRVREGVVVVDANNAREFAHAAEEVTVDSNGAITRGRISPYGTAWTWVEALADGFDISNRSLLEFLEWMARETGRSLEFADEGVRREARAAVLQGSTRGLGVAAALDSVMSTTNLAATAAQDRLVITRR